MAKAEYCDKCGRIKGIGCACDVPFDLKIKRQNFSLGTFKAVR